MCDPDPALARALATAAAAPGRRRSSARSRSPAHRLSPGSAVEEQHFERLRAWRQKRAAGKPAYTVAANAVLEEVLRRRPASVRALAEIRGIGPAFCAKHGESLLAELAAL